MRNRLAWPIVVLLPVMVLAAACLSRTGARQEARAGQPHPAASGRRAGHAADPQPQRALVIRRAPFLLPTAISGEAASPDGGHLLISGGLRADLSSSNAVVRIDLSSGASTVAGRLATPVHDAASAVLGGALLIFGGGTSASYATVQRYSPAGGGSYGALPAPRSDLAAVTLGRTAYLVGGHDGARYAQTVLATSDGRHFRAVAALPVPVRYPAVAAAGGFLWIIGGLTPRGPVAAVQRVSLRTGAIRLDGSLPRPLEAAVAFTLNGTIYVAGGLTTPGRPGSWRGGPLVTSSAVWRFDQTGQSFAIAGRLPVPVSHAAVTVTGDSAYLVGGLDGTRTVRTVTLLRLGHRASPVPVP